MFYTNAISEAIEIEEAENKVAEGHLQNEDDKKDARDRRIYWAVLVSALVIFTNNSRAIQFFLRSFLLIASFGIVYGSSTKWTLAAVGVLFPFLFIESHQIVVFLGRKIGVSDDDLNFHYFEKSFEYLLQRYRSSTFLKSILFGCLDGFKGLCSKGTKAMKQLYTTFCFYICRRNDSDVNNANNDDRIQPATEPSSSD